MELKISEDRLKATVIFIEAEYDSPPSFGDVQKLAEENRISAELKQDDFLKFLKHPGKSTATCLIAVGQPPSPARNESYRLMVHPLEDAHKIKELESLLSEEGGLHHHICRMKFPSLQLVKKNDTVAKFMPGSKGTDGLDIFGNEVPAPVPDTEDLPPLETGDFVLKAAENVYQAAYTGVMVRSPAKMHLLPVEVGLKFDLTISPDALEAHLIIYPALDAEPKILEREVMTLLTQKGVTYGIDNAVLPGLNRLLREAKEFPLKILIAEGKKPENGKDGSVKFLVETGLSLKPAIREDGTADFHNIKSVEIVTASQPLAKLLPPEPGEDGIDVKGQKHPAKPGKPGAMPRGTNAAPDPRDPNTLVSQIDGNVKLEMGKLNVYPGYMVKGSVDLHTGNIFYKGSLTISEDVKAGFLVHATCDIDVKGAVEDAVLNSGGNVFIKSGFAGTGKGQIHSRGDCNIGFVSHQTVKAKGDIHVLNGSLGANLYSQHRIFGYGRRCSLAGGTAMAWHGMELEVLGNPAEIKGVIILGWNYKAFHLMERYHAKLNELNPKIKKLEEGLKKVQDLEKRVKTLPPPAADAKIKISQALDVMLKRQNILDKRLKAVENKYPYNSKARLVVKKEVFPGTMVQIGYDKLPINKTMHHAVFFLEGRHIKVAEGGGDQPPEEENPQ
jgi:uncharacterized protein (DUF342 family)